MRRNEGALAHLSSKDKSVVAEELRRTGYQTAAFGFVVGLVTAGVTIIIWLT